MIASSSAGGMASRTARASALPSSELQPVEDPRCLRPPPAPCRPPRQPPARRCTRRRWHPAVSRSSAQANSMPTMHRTLGQWPCERAGNIVTGRSFRFHAGGADATLQRCQAAQGSGRASAVLDAAPHRVRPPGRHAPRLPGGRHRPPEIVFVGGSMATTLAWEDPATAKGFRRLASFARLTTYDQWGTGNSDRIDPSDAPNLDRPGRRPRGGDRAGGRHRPRPLRDPQRRCRRRPLRRRAPGAPAGPVQHMGPPAGGRRLPDRFQRRVLDRLEERYRTEWGQGRIYNEFAPRYDDAPPGQVELASTSQNQLVTIFRINRTYDIRSVLPTHLGADAGHPPGGTT